ncbi:hypothetical protein [Neorhizobium alkalisoli]|uniref:Uncharacterized protein n=1 Tax=Neorhizobium alkalisoli TaxID=528178 RepID=A0A561R302_9HYPH|nr:hypothetical protein [Neorhizobium alkalisoli]TWF56994.1 hypothetical protein FHW37_102634 [Neorhizobium alkalisoli]
MDGIKEWYQSKTIWGALIAVAASVLHLVGFDLAPDAQGELADIAVTLVGAFGGLLSIYGRLVATASVARPTAAGGGTTGG